MTHRNPQANAFSYNSDSVGLAEHPSWVTPTDDQQLKIPVRTGVALAIGVLLWLGPYLGLVGVLVPQQVARIDPAHKTADIALMSTVAMIVSTIANVIEGGLSDRTRSRWGRRTPWIVAGSVGTFVCMLFWAQCTQVWQVVLSDSVYMIFLNMIVAPLIAVIADRTSPKYRGTISSVYALGNSAGQYGGQMLASFFLPIPKTGFVVMAVMSLLSGPVAALILREQSTKGMSVPKVTLRTFSDNFVFPTKHVRDYYLALFGKLCMQTASFAISGYQLYILTDYILLKGKTLQGYVSAISMIMMVTAIVLCIVAGPVSDKLKMRKMPVIVSGILIALGSYVPYLTHEPYIMLVYALIVGIGMGMFNSVDQALNIEVLPDPRTAAKDLGILNIANNGGQVFGPIFSAAVIQYFGYRGIFPLAAGLALMGVILVFFIRKVR
ncbi:MFS transporter [Bifidobacterium xylocopae]|uniref:MFS transporter n=1 Tax=Bifidobacterium xylocopae TaxID=2493119 RepID=A0A366KET1_9BIFI|nr:MFS transporter [Bifidobacterium xylocopae]RBP99742.1 MFS transporter [Bifidobacterium xylocopae]